MARRKKYELTPEHRAMFAPWAARWIANAMSTAQMTDEDRVACTAAVHGMYAAANLPPPRVVFAPSPFVAAFASGFASGIWCLRATAAATAAATYAATADATADATYDATYAATADATRVATYIATRDATAAATYAATRDATYAATAAATYAATRVATRDATADATYAATRVATANATADATYDATYDATAVATADATRDATAAATADATAKGDLNAWYALDFIGIARVARGLGGENAKFLLECAALSWRTRQGGNQWSGYDAYLSFFQDVAKLDLPQYAAYQHWRVLAERSGPRYLHPEFCIISDRPEILTVDAQNRPHADDGPFCRWRDGSALYSVHGVRVPGWVVEHPERITVANINVERNQEVRRVLIERYRRGEAVSGAAAYLRDIGATIEDTDERWGTLRSRARGGDTDLLILEVVNRSPEPDGSFRHYHLRIHPELRPMLPDGGLGNPQKRTALNAVASTFGLTGAEYAKRMGALAECES